MQVKDEWDGQGLWLRGPREFVKSIPVAREFLLAPVPEPQLVVSELLGPVSVNEDSFNLVRCRDRLDPRVVSQDFKQLG
ncbi:MAG: hypothetical protein IPK93_05055 [Solirubrobacterales bacterium]|nr:hypothetical protein [Solirubrobacterales bacterium]